MKTTFGVISSETNINGTLWNQKSDEFIIGFTMCVEREENGALIKRKMLSVIKGVFDTLAHVSPLITAAKVLYS